jgi:hypothetical protein
MVSQSISVFFLLKNQEAFFRNEGRPLEREKSPLHTRRTNLLTERNKGVLGKKEKKRKVQLNFNSSRQEFHTNSFSMTMVPCTEAAFELTALAGLGTIGSREYYMMEEGATSCVKQAS